MSDAVAVALITGGATAAVGIVANVITYAMAGRSLRAEAAQRNDLLREEGRKQRQDAYLNFLTSLTRYDAIMTGQLEVDDAGFAQWLDEYQARLNALYVIGHEEVVDAAEPVVALLHELSDVYRRPEQGETILMRHQRAYLERREEFKQAGNLATRAMRIDVAKDLGMPADLPAPDGA